MQHWIFYLSFTYFVHIKNPIDQKLYIQYEFYCGFSMDQQFFGKVTAMIGLKYQWREIKKENHFSNEM